jgi:hypothetical protein
MYQCPSYYNDDNELVDCKCERCAEVMKDDNTNYCCGEPPVGGRCPVCFEGLEETNNSIALIKGKGKIK